MMPPVLYVPPPGGGRSSAEAWIGEKTGTAGGGDWPSPPRGLIRSSSDDETDETVMCIVPSQVLEKEFVFSADDDVSDEELSRCCEELRSREHLIYVDHARKIRGKAEDSLYERLSGLRSFEFKILKDRGDFVVDTMHSHPIWEFEDASESGPSMFGWTIDTQYYHLSELNDYQRIVPMRAMSFEDALKQTLSENVFHYPSRIEAKIEGCGPIYFDFKSCMDHVLVIKGDETMKLLITNLVNKAERPKIYVDYVKKEIEVARRIGLTGLCVL